MKNACYENARVRRGQSPLSAYSRGLIIAACFLQWTFLGAASVYAAEKHDQLRENTKGAEPGGEIKQDKLEIAWDDLDNDGNPEALMVSPAQKLWISASGGRIRAWQAGENNKVIVPWDEKSGMGMDLFWLPGGARWTTSPTATYRIVERGFKDNRAFVTLRYTVSTPLVPDLVITKTYSIDQTNPDIKVSLKFANVSPSAAITFSYWSHNVFGLGAADKLVYPTGKGLFVQNKEEEQQQLKDYVDGEHPTHEIYLKGNATEREFDIPLEGKKKIKGTKLPVSPDGKDGKPAQTTPAGDKPLFSFLQLTDLHVYEDDVPGLAPSLKRQQYYLANEKFKWMVETINAERLFPLPAFVLFTGDMIHGMSKKTGVKATVADIKVFKEILQPLRCPYYPLVGNHECFQMEHSKTMLQPYCDAFGDNRLNYTFEHGGILFIMLNDSGAPASNSQPSGQERNQWLKSVMDGARDKPKIICCHIPIVPVREPDVLEASFYFGSHFVKDSQLQEIIDANADTVIAVLAGHLHLSGCVVKNGIYHIVSSGLASYPCDYRLFTVYEDRIKVQARQLPPELLRPAGDPAGFPGDVHFMRPKPKLPMDLFARRVDLPEAVKSFASKTKSEPITENWFATWDEQARNAISITLDKDALLQIYKWSTKEGDKCSLEWMYQPVDLKSSESWETEFKFSYQKDKVYRK